MAVALTRSWLGNIKFDGDNDEDDGESESENEANSGRVINVIGWSNEGIVTELSAVLKTLKGGNGQS